MSDAAGDEVRYRTSHKDDPTKHPYLRPKDAATLVIIDRNHKTPKVLVGKRHGKVVFMPNALVFPGGRVDPKDNTVPVGADVPSALLARLMEGSPTISPARARALAIAAIREACEETGLCIGKKVDGRIPPLPPVWQPFADAGLLPDPSMLCLVARAITPPGRVKRFDTRFFAADASAVAHKVPGIVHADAELVELSWVDIDAEPLSHMHLMTVNVLNHLKKLLAEGPLSHEVPIVFYKQKDGRMRLEYLAAKG